MAELGSASKVYIGQGTNVVHLQHPDYPVRGSMTITNTAVLQTLGLAGQDYDQTYGIRASMELSFDRILVEDEANVKRLTDWMAALSDTADDAIGEIVVAFGGNALWLRNVFTGSATLALPYDDLASVSGAPGAQMTWPGSLSAVYTINQTNQTPASTGEATFQAGGGIVILTDARTGTADLNFQYKRGAAAWTLMSGDAHAESLPTITTPGSAVALDTSELMKDDRVRVAYSNTVTAGNEWTGRLASCAPIRLG